MSKQASQLRTAKKLSNQLRHVDSQLSENGTQLQRIQSEAADLSSNLGGLGVHQALLEEIENKLGELNTAQKTLNDSGQSYLKDLDERCNRLESLRESINRRTWLHDNGLRLAALILIGISAFGSIGLLASTFPTSTSSTHSNREQSRDAREVGSSHEVDGSTSAEEAPIPTNTDVKGRSAEPSSMGPEVDVEGGNNDDVERESVDEVQGSDIEVASQGHSLATDGEFENLTTTKGPLRVQTRMSLSESRVWSFGVLALSVAMLFGFIAFTVTKIVVDE